MERDLLNYRVIAYYLPQYHPIPENDAWWGKGFTEWTNVTKAKPLFRGHIQPKLPADLGFYDLRVPEVRQAQADLAKQYGIEGFCYWHYWLGNGRQLLQRPFEEVLKTGSPDFPFCLGWANHSWTGIWFGAPGKTLATQEYPGKQDHLDHFHYLLPAFLDKRYMTVDGKPLFLILRSQEIPEVYNFIDIWQEMAVKSGLKGIHFVAHDLSHQQLDRYGFDACTYAHHRIIENKLPNNRYLRAIKKIYRTKFKIPAVYHYKDAIPYFIRYDEKGKISFSEYPCAVSNWDSSPRLGKNAVILHGSTPELFKEHFAETVNNVSHKPFEHRIIFLKSWNEWAEGNYVEPDQLFGHGYLQAIKDVLTTAS